MYFLHWICIKAQLKCLREAPISWMRNAVGKSASFLFKAWQKAVVVYLYLWVYRWLTNKNDV